MKDYCVLNESMRLQGELPTDIHGPKSLFWHEVLGLGLVQPYEPPDIILAFRDAGKWPGSRREGA